MHIFLKNNVKKVVKYDQKSRLLDRTGFLLLQEHLFPLKRRSGCPLPTGSGLYKYIDLPTS